MRYVLTVLISTHHYVWGAGSQSKPDDQRGSRAWGYRFIHGPQKVPVCYIKEKGLNVSLLFTRLGWKNEREAEKQMSARMSLCSEHSLTAASVPEYVGESNSTLSPGFTSISNTCQNKRRNTSLDRTPWGPTQWLRDWTPYSAGQFKSPPILRK